MPPPKTPKEVKQFLGLIGYYRKFVPRFSDLARPLNALTRKDVPFEWNPICQESFELLKTSLMTEPILTYPDPNHPYVLFTDASKYAWACALTQEKTHQIEGKETKILHPITYMSGLFCGSQMNWACLTKEAYAIYMSIKKLAYYLEDADITLKSDHLPLKKFLVIAQILKMAHDDLGHNGTHRTYMLLKRLYYWKGLKLSVMKHIQRCYHCQRRNKQVVKYATLHFDVTSFPMQFISMDLIGEFHPPTSKGK